MITNKLIIGSVNIADYGCYCSDAGIYTSPSLVYNTETIDGKNGSLHIDKGRYSDVTIQYKCVIPNAFQTQFYALKGALLSQKGKQRIEDGFNSTVYRKGILSSGIEGNVGVNKDIGTFTLEFDCDPQRWLKSGEKATTLTTSGTITNPTLFEAKPLIRVYGTGTLEVGKDTIVISKGATSYIDIDCEIQDCYEGTTNRNGLVSLTDFPTLKAGSNGITLGSGITKVKITPRWWTV